MKKTDIDNLIREYEDIIHEGSLQDKFVITANAMTVNKKNGRFVISNDDHPFLFNRGFANYRIAKERSKNSLIKFSIVEYSKWLNERLRELYELRSTVDESTNEESLETSRRVVINIVTNRDCPIECNNCICCKFNYSTHIERDRIVVECIYKD